jgi:hypothetical protein
MGDGKKWLLLTLPGEGKVVCAGFKYAELTFLGFAQNYLAICCASLVKTLTRLSLWLYLPKVPLPTIISPLRLSFVCLEQTSNDPEKPKIIWFQIPSQKRLDWRLAEQNNLAI